MANAIHRDSAAVAWLGQTAARYLLAVSLPAAVCCTLIAGPILVLLYGEPFRSAAPTLAVLMWTLVPYGWVRYHAYVLVAAGRQRIDLALNALMSAVNVLLNLVLIPRYSHLGAAIATLASVCIYGVIQYGYLQRHLPGLAAPVLAHRTPLIAAAVTALCIWLVRDHSVFLAFGIVPVVYGGTLVVAGFFTTAELQIFGVRRVLQSVGLAARVK
jgi:O-antigen/teichoic acid export membrane protein